MTVEQLKLGRRRKDDYSAGFCGRDLCSHRSELDLDAEAPPSKRPRTDNDDTDFSMASLARGEVTQVGVVNCLLQLCR